MRTPSGERCGAMPGHAGMPQGRPRPPSQEEEDEDDAKTVLHGGKSTQARGRCSAGSAQQAVLRGAGSHWRRGAYAAGAPQPSCIIPKHRAATVHVPPPCPHVQEEVELEHGSKRDEQQREQHRSQHLHRQPRQPEGCRAGGWGGWGWVGVTGVRCTRLAAACGSGTVHCNSERAPQEAVS